MRGYLHSPTKMKNIEEFELPTTQKQLLRFLGMLNFYRKTLPNLKTGSSTQTPADVLQPLYTAATLKMAKKEFTTYWTKNNLKTSFDNAKTLLRNCVTLSYPNPSIIFYCIGFLHNLNFHGSEY